jgi:hypothetical protein
VRTELSYGPRGSEYDVDVGADRALGSSDPLEMEDAKRDRERADMSHIRILNEAGNDVLRIDMGTGRVEVLRPTEIGDAARAWWDAVETIARATTSEASPPFRNLVFKDVGESGQARPHGDIILQPGRAAPEKPEGSGGSVLVKTASESSTPPQGHVTRFVPVAPAIEHCTFGPDEDFDAMPHQRLIDRADHLQDDGQGSRDEPPPGWRKRPPEGWVRAPGQPADGVFRPWRIETLVDAWDIHDSEHGTGDLAEAGVEAHRQHGRIVALRADLATAQARVRELEAIVFCDDDTCKGCEKSKPGRGPAALMQSMREQIAELHHQLAMDNKRGDRAVAQLCLTWVDALRENPSWRNGQALFNALTQVLPAIAEEVRGSPIDPFHNNRTMANVLAFVLVRLADPREKPGGERTSAVLKAAREAAAEWNADPARGSALVATVAADALPEVTQLAGGGWALYFRAKHIDESERACRAALARLLDRAVPGS